MVRIARVVAPGVPHHITQRGTRRHGSGNEYGVPGTSNWHVIPWMWDGW